MEQPHLMRDDRRGKAQVADTEEPARVNLRIFKDQGDAVEFEMGSSSFVAPGTLDATGAGSGSKDSVSLGNFGSGIATRTLICDNPCDPAATMLQTLENHCKRCTILEEELKAAKEHIAILEAQQQEYMEMATEVITIVDIMKQQQLQSAQLCAVAKVNLEAGMHGISLEDGHQQTATVGVAVSPATCTPEPDFSESKIPKRPRLHQGAE